MCDALREENTCKLFSYNLSMRLTCSDRKHVYLRDSVCLCAQWHSSELPSISTSLSSIGMRGRNYS